MVITKQQFPEQASTLSPSTWALTCLLHDIGTSEHNLTATRMSFDIYGGIKALDILNDFGATPDQAEAVAEAIIRHQDIGVHGTITYIGQLIQLATIYDNVGAHPYVKDFGKLIHDTTRAQVHEAHPPGEWRTFFSSVIQKEEAIKPWCHTKKMVNVMRNRSQQPDEQ
jgi:cyanamide hydratase